MHHALDVLVTMFGWPAGIVLGNLIANVAWLPLQWLGLTIKLKSHHSALHERLDEIEARLGPCPDCGHRRSAADLLRHHDSP
jgi:hypothetical protein